MITGTRSHPTLRRLSVELRRLLRRSEIVEIANAAHFAKEDQPAAYNRVVLDFLAARASTRVAADWS